MQALPERFSKLHKNSNFFFFFLALKGPSIGLSGENVYDYLEVGVGIFLSICSVHSLVLCMCLTSPQRVV